MNEIVVGEPHLPAAPPSYGAAMHKSVRPRSLTGVTQRLKVELKARDAWRTVAEAAGMDHQLQSYQASVVLHIRRHGHQLKVGIQASPLPRYVGSCRPRRRGRLGRTEADRADAPDV
jgi:hypothetical protein